MTMRLALAVLTAAVISFGTERGLAQIAGDAASPDPRHWSMDSDAEVHDASGAKCPLMVSGFALLQFQGASTADLLGSCTYVSNSGNGDAGLGVRRYVPSTESKEANDYDRMLMEPKTGEDAPMMAVQMAAVTTRDGTKGGRITITKARNGYLVDCYAEGANLEAASAKIRLICGN
jgi:hypothetical protein